MINIRSVALIDGARRNGNDGSSDCSNGEEFGEHCYWLLKECKELVRECELDVAYAVCPSDCRPFILKIGGKDRISNLFGARLIL